VDAACARKVAVKILVPDCDEETLVALSKFHRLLPAQFSESVQRATNTIEISWKERGQIQEGSSISIKKFDKFCGSSLIVVDKTIVSIAYLPCGSGGLGADHELVSAFDISQKSFPGSTYERHLSGVAQSSVLIYENVRGEQ